MRLGLSPRRVLIVGIATVAILGFAVAGVWALGGTKPTVAHKASTATVRRGTITTTASASGNIEPINERALTFGAGGTVATLTVKPGQTVYTGEVLATLDATDAQANVDSAQSALDAATTNLKLAEQQAAAPATTSTCAARAADYVVNAKPSPSASASQSAPATATPTPTPSSRKTSTPAPSRASGSGSGSGCMSQSGGGATGNQGQNSTGTDNLLRAQQALNNDQLALDQAESALTGTTITAPVAGRVLSVAGAVGDDVKSGGSGFIILGGAQSLVVQAAFSEADVAPIRLGQPATVALANHAGVIYHAKVTQIDPAGTTSGSLVKFGVQLTFTSVPAGLLVGQTANVAVTTGSIPEALYVPAAAISSGPNGTAQVTVRTAAGDSKQTVAVGVDGDQGTQITSGLTAGQVVVVN